MKRLRRAPRRGGLYRLAIRDMLLDRADCSPKGLAGKSIGHSVLFTSHPEELADGKALLQAFGRTAMGHEIRRRALPDALNLIDNELAVAVDGDVRCAGVLGDLEGLGESMVLGLVIREDAKPLREGRQALPVMIVENNPDRSRSRVWLTTAVETDDQVGVPL